MLQFFQNNWGTLVALLAVALVVFLAIRRMVLDRKAGIGICGQKCASCAKMGNCEHSLPEEPAIEETVSCGGACSQCQYAASCHSHQEI